MAAQNAGLHTNLVGVGMPRSDTPNGTPIEWDVRMGLVRRHFPGLEQPCTATAQDYLFITQVTVTCAQVSKWKWNL